MALVEKQIEQAQIEQAQNRKVDLIVLGPARDFSATTTITKEHDKKLCGVCNLGSALRRIAEKCSPKEKSTLDVLWARMEHAESQLDWLKGKAQDGEPIWLSGRMYGPLHGKHPYPKKL